MVFTDYSQDQRFAAVHPVKLCSGLYSAALLYHFLKIGKAFAFRFLYHFGNRFAFGFGMIQKADISL